MNPTLFASLSGIFRTAILLSDLGAGVVINTTGTAQLLLTSPDVGTTDAGGTWALAVDHSCAGGAGVATATPYLLTSWDGGVTWAVAAQGTILQPGDSLYEVVACSALGPLVAITWQLTGAPNPTATGKAYLISNDTTTAVPQPSVAVVTTFATPASSTTNASQAFVIAALEALTWKSSVRLATAAALPAYTRTGNVITANANGALTVDGVAVAAGDRLLVKNGLLAVDNGIYVVTDPGAGGAPYVLTRAGDMNSSADTLSGAEITVTEGATLTGQIWRLSTANPIVLNTTSLVFAGQLRTEDPVGGKDAMNFQTAQALSWKAPARLATVLPLAAYTRVANVITANANGAIANIDGVAVGLGDRILLKNGAAGQDNGIYTVTQLGTGGTPFILTRATDYDASADVRAGDLIPVQLGTVNANTAWDMTTSGAITLNTTALVFQKAFGALVNTTEISGAYTALTTDDMILADASGGAVAIGMGADMTVALRRQHSLVICNVGAANNVTVTPNGGDTINSAVGVAAATLVLTPGQFVTITAPRAGTTWMRTA